MLWASILVSGSTILEELTVYQGSLWPTFPWQLSTNWQSVHGWWGLWPCGTQAYLFGCDVCPVDVDFGAPLKNCERFIPIGYPRQQEESVRQSQRLRGLRPDETWGETRWILGSQIVKMLKVKVNPSNTWDFCDVSILGHIAGECGNRGCRTTAERNCILATDATFRRDSQFGLLGIWEP